MTDSRHPLSRRLVGEGDVHFHAAGSRRMLALGAGFFFTALSAIAADATPQHADLSLGRIAPSSAVVTPEGQHKAEGLAHYAAARELEAEGRLRDALQHYREAMNRAPNDVGLAEHTASLVLSYEGKEAALKLLEDCIKTNPNSSEAQVNLARFLVTYEGPDAFTPDRATKVLSDALAKFPTSAAVYREAALLQLTRNLREEAMKIMEVAAKQTSTDPQFWLDTGRVAQEVWPLSHPDKRDEHRAKVNRFFEKALKLAPPTQGDVHMAVAQFYLLSNQMDRASEIAEALAKLTVNLEAKRLLVRLHQAAGREQEAISLLEDIVKEAPDDIEGRRLLISIYERKEEFVKAVPHAEALIQKAGGNSDEYAEISFVLLRANEVEKLRKLTLRGMGLFPNDPRFTHLGAIACRLQQRLDDALLLYQKSETLAQASNAALLDERFYSSWADTLQTAEKFDEAARMYQRAIDLIPQSEPSRAAKVLNNVGYMWLEQNKNLDQAGDFIQKATELDPKNPVYLDSLGWFHFLKGRNDQALKVLLEALALIPKPEAGDAEIFDHVAQAYLKLGDKPKAIDFLQRALKLDPAAAKIRKRMEEVAK